jgi:hypothetical protein
LGGALEGASARCIAEKRKQSAFMVPCWTAMPEVSPVGGAVPRGSPDQVTTARGWIFVRVNQVLVRLWTYLLALSDRMLMASSERGDRSEATVVC